MSLVRAAFARAARYDRDNPLLSIERPETEARLPALAGRDVLDLGAGHGYYARLARARGARRVVAIDLCLPMLEGRALPAVAADAAALPIADAAFDVVIAALVLSYVDRPRALAEAARVLRPGGVWVISELHAEGAAAGGWRRTLATSTRDTVALDAPPPAPAGLASELARAGFVVERLEPTRVDERLAPYLRRAGRRDLPELLGMPLLLHVVARRRTDG